MVSAMEGASDGRWTGGFVGFLGWDGGVYAAWEGGRYDVPLFGGWRTTAFATACLGVTAAAGAMVGMGFERPSRWRSRLWQIPLALAWTLPIALAVSMAATLALEGAGLWDGWIVEPSGLRHRARAWPHTQPLPLWVGFFTVWVGAAALFHLGMRRARSNLTLMRCLTLTGLPLNGFALALSIEANFSALSTALRCLAFIGLWSAFAAWGAFTTTRVGQRYAQMREAGLISFVCADCAYDLRGTVAADRSACPECGRTISERQREQIVRGMSGA